MVIRPIEVTLVNHRAPSGPAVIPKGSSICWLLPEPEPKSVTTPSVVILPIVFLPPLVNQRAPSGPAVMPKGPVMVAGA